MSKKNKTFPENLPEDKNVSSKYPNGRTLKTADKYLPTGKNGKSNAPKDKRRVAIIDSNRYDELAVVRLTTKKQPNTSLVKGYNKGKSAKKVQNTYFKHFVEITDDEGKPIKVDGEKFVENPWDYDLSAEQVAYIRQEALNGKRQSQENRKKIAALKSSDGKKGKNKR